MKQNSFTKRQGMNQLTDHMRTRKILLFVILCYSESAGKQLLASQTPVKRQVFALFEQFYFCSFTIAPVFARLLIVLVDMK